MARISGRRHGAVQCVCPTDRTRHPLRMAPSRSAPRMSARRCCSSIAERSRPPGRRGLPPDFRDAALRDGQSGGHHMRGHHAMPVLVGPRWRVVAPLV